MGRLTTQDLVIRIGHAWDDTESWRTQLDDAYKLAAPGRNGYGGVRTPGDAPGQEIFDETLLSSLTRFVNRIQSELFPSFENWAKFEAGDTVKGLDEEQARELDALADVATDVCFATIRSSNFSQALTEMLYDLAFGTGVMMVNETPVGSSSLIECIAVDTAQMAFDSGPHGKVWGIFRKHCMRPHLVKETWPDATFPEGWERFVDESMKTKSTVDLDEAMYYNSDEDKWYFDVLLSKEAAKKFNGPPRIVEREFKRSIWLVPRWSRRTGEVRGRGPVLEALPAAKTLNRVKELLLINASVQIHPVMTYLDDNVFNPGTASLVPGSLIAVGNNAGHRGPTLQRLEMGGDLRLSQFIFEEQRMVIKKIMLDDQLPPEAGSVRSATEWTSRQKELFQNIVAPYSRVFAEFTKPFMQLVLDAHIRAGVLPPMEVDGHNITLRATSNLSQGENINEISSMAQLVEMTSLLGEDIQRKALRVTEIPRFYGERMGLPNKYFPTPEEIQAQEEQEMMQQQAVQQQEQTNALELEGAKQQPAPQEGAPAQ